jgi:hypothetical protein
MVDELDPFARKEDTMIDNVELHVPLADATEKGSQLREALLQVPGVHSVGTIRLDPVSILADVAVEYDPAVTNPIVIHEQLAHSGFSVMLAAQEQ